MKILLINPGNPSGSGRDLYSAHILASLMMCSPFSRMYFGIPLALPTIAACTPDRHKVKIIDEEVEEINFKEKYDLVGLTAMTFKAPRAYEIARRFRSQGIPVVMGGIHASMAPNDAALHVDSVVIGEAEEIWPKILDDAEHGRLKKEYRAEAFPDLAKIPPPRHDLTRHKKYLYIYLQTTRGCPYDCQFCTVTKMNGRALRKKTPQQVMAEVDNSLKVNPRGNIHLRDIRDSSSKKPSRVAFFTFTDDNFTIDRKHALAVCGALQSYQKERGITIAWYAQANYDVGMDDEMLEALAAANCQQLFIGFESFDADNLKLMKKTMNRPQEYAKAISNIQRHGIHVIFSTIIGTDHDTPRTADAIAEFAEKNNVLYVLLNILTPFPGTDLREQMKKEGRILSDDWALYNIRNTVFQPQRMTPSELQKAYRSLCERLFRFDKMVERGMRLFQYPSYLYFPLGERLIICFAFLVTAILLGLQGRLCHSSVLRLLLLMPRLFLTKGTSYSLSFGAVCADYDAFARSECKRLSKSPAA